MANKIWKWDEKGLGVKWRENEADVEKRVKGDKMMDKKEVFSFE